MVNVANHGKRCKPMMGINMNRITLAAIAAVFASGVADAAPQLNAATLPNSRAVTVNSPATIFASVINSGDATATNCRVALGVNAAPSLSVSYSPADGAGIINGPADIPVSINAGATQQFLIAVRASAPFNGSVPLTYVCDNGQAISATGLNDLALQVSAVGTPDVIAIAATLTSDGIMQTNSNGRGIMSMAAVNIGSAGTVPPGPSMPSANEATITVRATITNFTDAGNQYVTTVCPSNASAVCTSPFANSFQAQIGDSPVFFNVALQHPTDIGIPFFPGELRLRVEFRDQSNNLVGATSVAPRSASPTVAEALPHGFWDMFIRDDSDPGGSFTRIGRLFFPPDGSTPSGGILREGAGGFYIQTVVLDGDLDHSNNQSRFLGCMRFLNSGNNDAAFPDINLRFVPRHFIRGSYDSGGVNTCPPPGNKPDVTDPTMDPVTSSGLMFGGYVDLSEDDGDDPASINWNIRNPIDEDESYGTASSTLTSPGNWSVSGTYRGCTITGTLSKYSTTSTLMGDSLALRASYTFTSCPGTFPQSSWNGLQLSGFLAIGDDEDDVEGLSTIFTDGFESGDTSSWIAVIP